MLLKAKTVLQVKLPTVEENPAINAGIERGGIQEEQRWLADEGERCIT